jgi:alkyl hydroperoxide reductase subunit AhpC
VTFPIVADADRALTKAFGVYDEGNDIAWPAVFVLNADGTVAWRSFEDNYKERVPIEDIVSAAQAAQGT